MSTKKNLMDKWIGWITDREGYIVSFFGPGARLGIERKLAFEFDHVGALGTCATSSQIGYALRPMFGKFRGSKLTDKLFCRMPERDKKVLEAVLNLQEVRNA